MRMHLSSSPGSGHIFWLSLLFRTSTDGKFYCKRLRKCKRYESVTAVGFVGSFLSSNLSANKGRSKSYPAVSQRSVAASQSVRRSTYGVHRGGEVSSI